jgi:peptide/nickel transport system substrate-binding protein
VAFAIDKKELATGRTWGFAKPINQRYPSSNKWFIDLKDRDQDLQKARALLAEASYRDGLKVKVAVFPGPDMELLTVLKEQVKKAGMDLEFDVMDVGAYTKVRLAKQFTLRIGGMGGRADPDQVYYADLHSRSGNNDSGYANSDVDRMLERAREVLDFKERKRLYTEVVQIIQRDVPEIYLSMGPTLLGVRPNVKGFSTGGLEERIAYMGGGLAHTWIED